jgi:pimeloyl-ACP methyl ester carboxylesterase
MFRHYIERREKFLHGRDTNRKSLPFEWGLEHLELPINGNPAAALRDYATEALNNSYAFYSCDPAVDYKFNGEILKFSSASKTVFPENNTVYGRVFDASKDLAVIVLPQWNSKWEGQIQLCRVLQRAGIGSVRLSMPYHHYRKPAQLARSEYLISSNIGRTIAAMRQAVLDVRRTVDWLLDRGYRRVGVVGTSIGSCIAFLAFAHDERLSTGIFIHVSSFFADVVWKGLSTAHVRIPLTSSVDLDELRYLWSPISPHPFIRRLRNSKRRLLMLAGRFDPTFLPELTQEAFDELDRCEVTYDQEWLPCGHYTMGEFPFNAVVGYRVVRFLWDCLSVEASSHDTDRPQYNQHDEPL